MNTLLTKAKKKLLNYSFGLGNGLKAADKEIFGSANNQAEGHCITASQSNSLWEDLLQGKKTQQVQELAYETMLVDRAARKRDLTNREEKKKELKENFKKSHPLADKRLKKQFFQNNDTIPDDSNKSNFIQFEGKSIEDITKFVMDSKKGLIHDKHRIKITYSDFVGKYKIEELCEGIDVFIEKGKKAKTILHFSSVSDKDARFLVLSNDLKRLYDNYRSLVDNNRQDAIKTFLDNNLIIGNIVQLSFTTYKATNLQDDNVTFTFAGKPELKNIEYSNCEYKLELEWDSYNENDLIKNVYNEIAEEKFKNKAPREKQVYRTKVSDIKDCYCSECGAQITAFESEESKKAIGAPLCIKCLNKKINSLEKNANKH